MMEPDAMVGGLPFPERKLTKFLIMFDNSNLLYFPGQFLSGRVIVELQEEMAITGTMLNTHPCLNLCSNMSIIIYSSVFAGNTYLLTSKGNSTSRMIPSKDSARVEGRLKARGVTKEGAYYV